MPINTQNRLKIQSLLFVCIGAYKLGLSYAIYKRNKKKWEQFFLRVFIKDIKLAGILK